MILNVFTFTFGLMLYWQTFTNIHFSRLNRWTSVFFFSYICLSLSLQQLCHFSNCIFYFRERFHCRHKVKCGWITVKKSLEYVILFQNLCEWNLLVNTAIREREKKKKWQQRMIHACEKKNWQDAVRLLHKRMLSFAGEANCTSSLSNNVSK